MVDISEDAFADLLEQHFEDEYGAENVSREHHLPETGRVADFWIQTPDVILAVEVENDAEHLVAGTGQALLYSAHDKNSVPVVAYPKGNAEQPELMMLSEQTSCIYLPYDPDDL